MPDSYSVRHVEQRAITNADQVEFQSILSGSAVLETGVYDERLSGESEDMAVLDNDVEIWHKQDVTLDGEVGPIRDEILRRINLLGPAYPFTLSRNSLNYQPSLSKFYEYCLGICLAPNVTKNPFVKLPRSFERVTADLVKSYMGVHSKSFHTGAPRDAANGTTFEAAMQNLSLACSNSVEWRWSPEPGYPEETSIGGDGGVDFVVWKRALDKRIGQLFIVGQCACGNDWDTKFNDLREDRLKPWFRPLTYVNFVRCFATPFMLSDGNFLAAHHEAGWTLDRARLVMMAESACHEAEYQNWIPILNQMFALSRDAA